MNYCPSSEAGARPEYPRHIPPFTARDMLLGIPVEPKSETVSLDEALDRVLADDAYAFFPMPPFNKSPFDGYAFRACDTPGALRIVRRIAAGDEAGAALEKGEAVRIFTGAPVPGGADVVVKQEDVRLDSEMVNIYARMKPDTNVIHAGEDYETGAKLVSRGQRLTPALLGVLASQDYWRVNVFKRPRVSLISTGSELYEVGEERGEYGIYNSSVFILSGYLRRIGFEVVPAGTVPDEPESIRRLTETGLDTCDLVITTGGASIGDYDYALATAESVGAEVLFWKCGMKPGGAILASLRRDRLLLSLSGNPAAAVMGLLVVAQPYLRKLCGQTDTTPEMLTLPLLQALPKTSSSTRLLRGRLEFTEGTAYFAENKGRGNGNMASFDGCELIGFIPPTDAPLPAGTVIEALRLPGGMC